MDGSTLRAVRMGDFNATKEETASHLDESIDSQFGILARQASEIATVRPRG